jgi:uncharacterized protein (DUF849 family)
MDRNKVIICVAPVSHTGKAVPPGCRNPLTAEEVAAEVADCAAAGAGMVHLHVRDEAGAQTFKLDVFSQDGYHYTGFDGGTRGP